MKKQLLLSMAIVLTALMSMGQTLNIGGHRAPLDSFYHLWLCSVPQSTFGTDYSASVNFDEELTELFIDSIAVNDGDTIVFENIEGGKLYPVTAQMGDSLITGAITFTWLPIVELYGNFNAYYHPAYVIVSEPDSAYAEPIKAKVKTRGGATDANGKHKRNYRIKFQNEDSASTKLNKRFFGLRNDNSWNLDAGQMDFLRVRNRVSTDLWLDMARKPWYSDTVANVRNGSRGQMVEVMLNGEYRGIYNMCEPIDRKQLKLNRYDTENREYHGMLYTAYTWTKTVSMSEPSSSFNVTRWDGFEAKYPDYDEIKRVNWKPLREAVWFANRADKDSVLFADSIGVYFDMPVMEDYFIFIVALQALDNESKNIYYACRDIAEDPRFTMVPWDLDICLGQNYAPGVNIPDMVKPEQKIEWISHLPMVNMWNNMDYRREIIARYKELRETVLNTDNLVNRYRDAINELENCGAAEREEVRWSGDSDLARKKLDLSAEMDYVEDWIRRRMDFIDENVFIEDYKPDIPDTEYLIGDVNGDGEVNIADINAIIDIILGGSADEGTLKRADVNNDNEINIADVNVEIDIILS
ncbi:MAG: CotH kinase family protein [Muribaculaceae bacterium]|nr:CotH kinase family protein [Muribaculaceae bacterium]